MFKSETHNVFTEKVNKIAIIFNDDKRQSFNRVKSYPYGTRVGKICKEELLVLKVYNSIIKPIQI